MAKTNRSCAACLSMQRKIEEQVGLEAKTLKCFAGLCDSAVPVRVGENLIAFLTTGQVLLHAPSREQFARTARTLLKWGAEVDVKRLEEAYFQTRVVSKKQYESVIRLLSIFAQHLSSLSNQSRRRTPSRPRSPGRGSTSLSTIRTRLHSPMSPGLLT